jgi:hypothetical protein
MTNVPDGPWLNETAAIGPILKVCPISSGASGMIAVLVLLFIFLNSVLLGFLGLATYAAEQPGLSFGLDILRVLVFFWMVLCLKAIVCGIVDARKRLLLGERGIALWTPWRTRVIRFADLGTAWRCITPARDGQPLTVVLEHANGERVAINGEFEDHHRVALRVLAELERRSSERIPEPRQEGTSDAIKPAERDITEPRNQPGGDSP